MCVCEEMDCNPQNCPYAEGHFDRVNDAVFELLQKEEIFTRDLFRAGTPTQGMSVCIVFRYGFVGR